MRKSNYEHTKEMMQRKFLLYDQQRITDKFGLKSDEDFLYLRFVGRDYRIGRRNGKVEWTEDAFQNTTEAGYNEAMSIYDLLCDSKTGCHLSGKYVRVNNLKGTVYSSGLGDDSTREMAQSFDGKTDRLALACRRLGGIEEKGGDVAFCIWVFEYLPVILRFWESDDEFDASLQLLWDENTIDYIRYETTYYVAAHLLSRLKELMER